MARTLSLVAVVSVIILASAATMTARRSGDADGMEKAVQSTAVTTGTVLARDPHWRGAPGRDSQNTSPATELNELSDSLVLLASTPVRFQRTQARMTPERSTSALRPAGFDTASAANAPVGDTGSSEPSPSTDGPTVPADRGQADAQDRPSTPTPEIAGCVLLALGGLPCLFRRKTPA